MDYPVIIHVQTKYLNDPMTREKGQFAFAYQVIIQNQGDIPIQLLYRHWLITDGNGEVKEVHGEGVVGKQPVIAPNDFFSYTSGAVIDTQVGVMQGSYDMQTRPPNSEPESFSAVILPFRLATPQSIN
ncbi:Co2+/Mg2+ efflux protein ApaG [Alteromonas sediminis]|uniref:Co2+/Mg2+ efflux protein ApaG n=1 Tax=Alteromonas sediminis TaxID=2259342 RepID=A0A3N5Y605_9ALTE|nr:Co2+/Mg2+ efflux protein ApaG [Alteromonas sediminis]RPJ65759.1 Co2+/Mg2+ efflux protein ApaG [Alteromonas sediminis]